MTEVEILRKMAVAMNKSIAYKAKYDSEMKEWYQARPFADQRRSKSVYIERGKKINPLYEKYKENKRQAEGYLFMWSQNYGN